MAERKASVERDTLETQIKASINLDGTGKARFDIGVPFLEHMLDQIARHGLIDLDIVSKGDLHIDDHHTVEDVGITLGQAFSKAIGDKKGIRRYGHAYVPLDEALSRVVIDFSGRPGLQMHVPYTRATDVRFRKPVEIAPGLAAFYLEVNTPVFILNRECLRVGSGNLVNGVKSIDSSRSIDIYCRKRVVHVSEQRSVIQFVFRIRIT